MKKQTFKPNLGVWRAKACKERRRKRRLTCAMHSGPLLPLVWNCSELRRCPGSDQGGRSAEVHAACRWSSGWNHQSVEQSDRVHNGKVNVSGAIWFNLCKGQEFREITLAKMTPVEQVFIASILSKMVRIICLLLPVVLGS